MKTTVLLLLLSVCITACSNTSALAPTDPAPGPEASVEGDAASDAPRAPAGRNTASSASAPDGPAIAGPPEACPGGDFAGFLDAFAADPELREKHTAAFVKVVDWRNADEPTEGTVERLVPRSSYRDFTLTSRDGAFYNVASDGSVDPDPVEVELEQDGASYRVRYTYGMSEGNSWTFARSGSCWQLVSDPEPSSL